MNGYEVWEIAGRVLEYVDDSHTYVCDGIIVPSITQSLKTRFNNKYAGVDRVTLNRAAQRGTEVHRAIEMYCKTDEESDLPELRDFKFLQKTYKFNVLANETPVILFKDSQPILAGRLDMVIEIDGQLGLADIKSTSVLDKEYLAYQLNLYRIAYKQSYGIETDFLRGLHLRKGARKFVQIPINEQLAWDLVDEYERIRDGNIQG